MLHNSNWDRRPEPSLPGLIAWLRTMPAGGKYDFCDCHGQCLVGQYMAHLGIPWEYSSASCDTTYIRTIKSIFDAYRTGDCPSHRRWDSPAWCVIVTGPWTFGAALVRAEALVAAHPELLLSAQQQEATHARA